MGKLKLDDIEAQTTNAQHNRLVQDIILPKIPDGFFPIDALPSKMKLYPEGTRIFSRPLKILEVKQLSMINSDNFNEVINAVLEKTVKGIDIGDLIIADKLFIIFWQRANTYKGDSFAIEHKCNLCGEESKYNFDVSQLSLIDINDKFSVDQDFALKESSDILTFTQLTVKNEINTSEYLKKDPTADEDLLAIASVINTINGQPHPIKYKYTWLTNLGVADVLYLTQYFQSVEINLNPMLSVACSKCGGLAETPISFRPEFFLPEYRTE